MENDAVTIQVTVCYPTPQTVWQKSLTLRAGSTADQALRESGFQAAFPTVDAWAHGVGVFGKTCQPSTVLADGDRIEIYRALTFDPMVSRRRRADHRRAKATRERNGRERPAGLL
jgi:putative ubiquitin-RnfH superfamily antitoxin RatB of RatAB toxin-antitoxin module